LAHLITSKYVDALPLYRQEAIFARYGVSLPRATQAGWIITLAERDQPLINLMDERLRASGHIRIEDDHHKHVIDDGGHRWARSRTGMAERLQLASGE
jgi:transposase